MTEHRVGQTWKDRRRGPTATFTVLRTYARKYHDGTERGRVKGVLVAGIDGCGTHLRDLDCASAEKMFPYLIFNPEQQPVEGEK